MDAQRKAELGDPVDHALVQVDHELALLVRFAAGQSCDELLLVGHRGIARVLNQPVDQADTALDLRHETEGQQDFGPVIGVLGELGQEAHDRVGIQQLRHAVRRALVAFEVEPALFAVAGGDHDHPAVGQQVAIDRQGVGRCDAGAFAVVHRARYADEDHALHPGGAQVGEPLAQRRLVHERGHLRAQAVEPGQFRFDDRPEVQHVQFRLHGDGPIVFLGDHSGNHHVPDPALEAEFGRVPHHFSRVFECPLLTVFDVGRHQLERDGVEGHAAPLHQTTISPFPARAALGAGGNLSQHRRGGTPACGGILRQ